MSDEDRLREIHDAVGWDDRKALAWLWQDHAPLPPGGLSDEFYSALIAVAEWGAGVMYDRTLTPVQPPADHGDGSGAGGRWWALRGRGGVSELVPDPIDPLGPAIVSDGDDTDLAPVVLFRPYDGGEWKPLGWLAKPITFRDEDDA